MKEIQIPYGRRTLPLHIEEAHLQAVLIPRMHDAAPDKPEDAIVREALAHPIGTPTLPELARGKRNIVLVTSDHTRAVPSKITLPIFLEQLRSGAPDAEITILVATGLHRPTTVEEQRRMFGDTIVDRERIVVSNAFREEDFVDLGTLPSGASFLLHRLAAECDLLVTEGFIEPHFFAGFSGGRKSILPGICAERTIKENHSFQAIASPFAKTGVLEQNPIHLDMTAAARRAKVQFILNLALGEKKNIIAAFAGDLEKAHNAGVDFIRRQSQCPAETGDIVITSNGGYPLDQNLYQSPKAVATAEVCCREGAVIIMCCACEDGMGGEYFEKLITMGTPEDIESYLSTISPEHTLPEQWCPQIYARILKKHTVILVTTGLDHQLVRKANMIPASTLDEALSLARARKGPDARVVVIPDGVSVLAVP